MKGRADLPPLVHTGLMEFGHRQYVLNYFWNWSEGRKSLFCKTFWYQKNSDLSEGWGGVLKPNWEFFPILPSFSWGVTLYTVVSVCLSGCLFVRLSIPDFHECHIRSPSLLRTVTHHPQESHLLSLGRSATILRMVTHHPNDSHLPSPGRSPKFQNGDM